MIIRTRPLPKSGFRHTCYPTHYSSSKIIRDSLHIPLKYLSGNLLVLARLKLFGAHNSLLPNPPHIEYISVVFLPDKQTLGNQLMDNVPICLCLLQQFFYRFLTHGMHSRDAQEIVFHISRESKGIPLVANKVFYTIDFLTKNSRRLTDCLLVHPNWQ